MKPANRAPVYVSIYAELAEICRNHGYALAIHGSVASDFDLICIPWVEKPESPENVIQAMCDEFAFWCDFKYELKEHGRIAYSLPMYFGECYMDLSFMPANTH
jgi:hypothetical protein